MSQAQPKPYANVQPRYLTPTKHHDASPPAGGESTKRRTASPVVQRQQFPVAKQWQSISPKYDQVKEPPPPPKTPDASKPLEHWKEVELHRTLSARLGFHATPKFMDHLHVEQHPENSPRRQVAMAIEHAHSQLPGKPWQSTMNLGKKKTFDDLLPEYYATHAELAPPAPGASKASKKSLSSVGEYIRSGSPIRHHLHTTDHHDRVKRHSSPQPFRSPGVQENYFSALTRGSTARVAYSREEMRVQEDRAARATKQVPRTFTPRVAKLAPAYAIDHVQSGLDVPAPAASPAPRSVSREQRS